MKKPGGPCLLKDLSRCVILLLQRPPTTLLPSFELFSQDVAKQLVRACARAASEPAEQAQTLALLKAMGASPSPRLRWLSALVFVEGIRMAGAAANALAGSAASIMWPRPIDGEASSRKAVRRRSRSASMSSVGSAGAMESAEATADARSAGGRSAVEAAAKLALTCAPVFARLVSQKTDHRVSSVIDLLAIAEHDLALSPHDAPDVESKQERAPGVTARAQLAVQGVVLTARLLESCVRWAAAQATSSQGDIAVEVTRRVVHAMQGELSPEADVLDTATLAYCKTISFGLRCIGMGMDGSVAGKHTELTSVASYVGASLCLKSSSTALADGTLTATPPFAALLATLVTPSSRSSGATEAAL